MKRFRTETRKALGAVKPWVIATATNSTRAGQKAFGVMRRTCLRISQWFWKAGSTVLRACMELARSVIESVSAEPRRYVELAALVLVAFAALAFAVRYLWPIARRAAAAYYAATDVTKTSALFVALVALYVAWSNYRRGNSAIVRIVDVKESGSVEVGVNDNQFYSTFEVFIKVLGIPLRNPAVLLEGRIQFGHLSFPLAQFQNRKPVTSGGTLEKGMVAFYGVRSFDLDLGKRQMVTALADPKAEQVAICIYSNGYLVKRFPLQRRLPVSPAVRRWNGWAAHVNLHYFSLKRIKWGRPVVQMRDVIPKITDWMFPLERFARVVSDEAGGQAPAKSVG